MLKKISLVAAMALVAAATITSCKKSDSLATLPAPTGTAVTLPAEGDSVDFEDPETKGYLKGLANGAYGARNFHQGTVQDLTDTNQWATKAGTYYYSFDDNDGLSSAGISSYSFKFTGSATADLTVDTSRFTLRYINTAFESVTSTTGSTLIASGVASYNSITGVGNPSNAGWYVYSLVNHTVVAYSPRTYLLTKKSTSEVWKVRINSIYYNATPVGSPYPTNYPYMSFDYKHL